MSLKLHQNKIHIGTSGWSYKHWQNIFYPSTIKQTEWLSFYAQTFKVTELNASFYHLPKKETVQAWTKKIPHDFLFHTQPNGQTIGLTRQSSFNSFSDQVQNIKVKESTTREQVLFNASEIQNSSEQ